MLPKTPNNRLGVMLFLALLSFCLPVHASDLGDEIFFHLKHSGNRWELVTPNGASFYVRGVHGLRFGGDSLANGRKSPYQLAVEAKHGNDRNAWAHAAIHRIESWGFNTVGANSDSVTPNRRICHTFCCSIFRRQPPSAASTCPTSLAASGWTP